MANYSNQYQTLDNNGTNNNYDNLLDNDDLYDYMLGTEQKKQLIQDEQQEQVENFEDKTTPKKNIYDTLLVFVVILIVVLFLYIIMQSCSKPKNNNVFKLSDIKYNIESDFNPSFVR